MYKGAESRQNSPQIRLRVLQAQSRSARRRGPGWSAAALIRSSCRQKLRTELTRLMLQIEIRLQIGHHAAEFREVQGLVAIAERLLRTGMHFHQQAVRFNHGGGS